MAAVTGPSIHFQSQEKSIDGSETLPDGHPMGPIDMNEETLDQLCVGLEATIDEISV